MKEDNSLSPPSIKYLLTLPFLEMHEAAFILTDCWPENLIASAFSLQAAEYLRQGHNVLYIPKNRLNSKKMTIQFRKLFSELKESIENGELKAHHEILHLKAAYGANKTYFISTRQVILWALLKGFSLPDNILKIIDVHQVCEIKLKKNSNNVVQNKIVAQFILSRNPNKYISDLCTDDLMERFGTARQSNDIERKAIRRALNELFDSSGTSRGRPSGPRSYCAKPISEVMQPADSGIAHYYFPLLKTAVITSTEVKIEMIGTGRLFEMTEKDFLFEFLRDEVVELYIRGATVNALRFIRQFSLEALKERRYCHPKVALIPMSVREQMTIRQLWEVNKEFCLEPFTKEQRKLFET